MRSILAVLALTLPSYAAAQEDPTYAEAINTFLTHVDSEDVIASEDETIEVIYRYSEAEECVLKSISDIRIVNSSGLTSLRGSSTIPLRFADPDGIVSGQSESYGGFVEIRTLFSDRRVRKTLASRAECTSGCVETSEILIDKFVIETDQPDTLAIAVKTLVEMCEND